MRSHWIRVNPTFNVTGVLIRRGKFRYGYIYTGEGHVKMEAEIGVMHLQVKEHQGLPANTGRFFPRAFGGNPSLRKP